MPGKDPCKLRKSLGPFLPEATTKKSTTSSVSGPSSAQGYVVMHFDELLVNVTVMR